MFRFSGPTEFLPFLSGGTPFFAGIGDYFPFIAIIAVFLLVVVLPARKEKKAKANMLETLKKGDKVLLQAGMIGKIQQVKNGDDTVVVDFDGTKIPFLKSTIIRVFNDKKVEAKS
ncbi:MAG: preprotein translocase subunit YajC [Planctomycetota bacterium]